MKKHLFLLFVKFWEVLPRPLALTLARLLGHLAYGVLPKRRRTALDNVRRAYGPELTEAGVRRIARGSFVHMVLTFVEFARYAGGDEKLLSFEVKGIEYLREALKRGRGAILMTGHMGNWELGASLFALNGIPCHIVARRPSTDAVAGVLTEYRRRIGVVEIPRQRGMRGILKALRAGSVVAVVLDQYAGGHGVRVPFFGRETPTFTTPALLSLRYDIPVIPCCARRREDGQTEIHLLPETPADRSGATDEENVLRTTRRYAAILETFIREKPDQWLWMHRRWRE